MLKIGINLTPFAHFIHSYSPESFNLMHMTLEVEASNIDGIQFYYGPDFDHISLEQLQSISDHSKKFLNICVPIHTIDLSEVLKLNPSMITFCDSLNASTLEINPLNTESLPSDFENIVERLKNMNILSSIAIDPTVKDVKAIAKFEIDYVNLCLFNIHSSENRTEEIEALQKLEMSVLAAEKFGFGISIYGELSTFNVYEYNTMEFVEEIYTGKHLFERSIQVGLSSAVHEYTQLLKNI